MSVFNVCKGVKKKSKHEQEEIKYKKIFEK